MPDIDLINLYEEYQKKFRYKNRWQWWGEPQQSSHKKDSFTEEMSPVRVDVGTGIEYVVEGDDLYADQIGGTNIQVATDESAAESSRFQVIGQQIYTQVKNRVVIR